MYRQPGCTCGCGPRVAYPSGSTVESTDRIVPPPVLGMWRKTKSSLTITAGNAAKASPSRFVLPMETLIKMGPS